MKNSLKHIPEHGLDINLSRQLFYELLRTRLVEQRIVDLYSEQDMRCPTHISIGQEAVAVGVCKNLNIKDYAISAHRSHAHYLAKGGNLNAMFAELYGKETGCAKGKGGSMHLIDKSVGFLGCVPIVGSTIPIGVGASFGARLQKINNVTVIFFGDGATETGVFYESINFAAVHKLPILFVCENNLYSVNTGLNERQPSGCRITDVANAKGIESVQEDGQDLRAIYKVSKILIERLKNNEGPFFAEFMTYRWFEHCGPLYDTHLGFRPEGEYENWMQRDPVNLYRNKLIKEKILATEEIEDMQNKIEQEINQAVSYAQNSAFPDKEKLMEDVYASS